MNDTTSLGAFIESTFKSNSFVLFCGAGVSFNSGIPLATQLQYEILSEVLLNQITKHCSWASHPLGDNCATTKNRIKDIIDSQIPFEVIMEGALARNSDDILELFDCKNPNANHILIGDLVQKGVLRTIYTTNFDTLIEQYIRLRKKDHDAVSLNVLHTPEKIRAWSGVESNRNNTEVVKLHGCISDIASLKTTISKVAERKLVNNISSAIEKLLITGKHELVVVIGYSFSDHFDINPAIKAFSNSDKHIVLVDHTDNGCDVMNLSEVNTPKFLSEFRGWKIKCNTSVFLEELTKYYGIQPTKPRGGNDFDWKACVKRWGEKASIYNNWSNYRMMGYIYSRMGSHKNSILFYERAAWISSQAKDREMESYICSLISSSYQYLENFEKQETYTQKATHLSGSGNESNFFSLLSQGTLCYERNDFSGARLIFESMLTRTEFSDDDFKGRVYIGLAIANHGLGNFENSIEYSKKSLKISRENGNLENQCSSYINLGLAFADINDYRSSCEANESALLIANSLQNKKLIQNVEDNIGRNKMKEKLFGFKKMVKRFFVGKNA